MSSRNKYFLNFPEILGPQRTPLIDRGPDQFMAHIKPFGYSVPARAGQSQELGHIFQDLLLMTSSGYHHYPSKQKS